jgi:alkylated DNA repair protein (DNA oxidative demethylase)
VTARLLEAEPEVIAPGAVYIPGWLNISEQRELIAKCQLWIAQGGGGVKPVMPSGAVMSVDLTCLGWHWYPYGYRKAVTPGVEVGEFPAELGELAANAVRDALAVDEVVGAYTDRDEAGELLYAADCALINHYGEGAKMGMHSDRDEVSRAPVVSISLGDSAEFRFGNDADRGRPWRDLVLESGDLFVFGGSSRLCYHGVTKVLDGTADPRLEVIGERYNLTIRETGR